MNVESLREDIAIQLELLDSTVREINALYADVVPREPTKREVAAAAAFLSNFYGGVENILKRICHHYGAEIPSGDAWHMELFSRFCYPGFKGLPVLIDNDLQKPLAAYRRFRHVAYHGYAMQLDWERMVEGVREISDVYAKFKAKVKSLFDM